jgi:hypothetical protein
MTRENRRGETISEQYVEAEFKETHCKPTVLVAEGSQFSDRDSEKGRRRRRNHTTREKLGEKNLGERLRRPALVIRHHQ